MRGGVVTCALVVALLPACGEPRATGASSSTGDASSSSVGGGGGAGGSGGAPASYDGPPIPWDFKPFPEVTAPDDNPTSAAKVALGRLLYYDPILASDNQVACATCHSEFWGLGDALPLSVGVDGVGPAGPGRMGPNMTTRNALTLWNAAFRTELFWDGRSPSLELQALQPMKHDNEMDQPASKAAVRVAAVDAYVTLFQAAFPGESTPVTATNITRALASFERTFVTNHAPYDQYVAGDVGAMGDDEKRGMRLFASENCASCHAPPLFESARYENRIGGDDPGRFAITGDAADQGAFRVPTLRNARETGPYFHDGSVADLATATAQEVEREVAKGRAKPLSAGELDDLVAFLHASLMDHTESPNRPKKVPSGLPVPVDGDTILR